MPSDGCSEVGRPPATPGFPGSDAEIPQNFRGLIPPSTGSSGVHSGADSEAAEAQGAASCHRRYAACTRGLVQKRRACTSPSMSPPAAHPLHPGASAARSVVARGILGRLTAPFRRQGRHPPRVSYVHRSARSPAGPASTHVPNRSPSRFRVSRTHSASSLDGRFSRKRRIRIGDR